MTESIPESPRPSWQKTPRLRASSRPLPSALTSSMTFVLQSLMWTCRMSSWYSSTAFVGSAPPNRKWPVSRQRPRSDGSSRSMTRAISSAVSTYVPACGWRTTSKPSPRQISAALWRFDIRVSKRAGGSHASGCSAIRPENASRSGSSNWSHRIANVRDRSGTPSRMSRRLSRSQARSHWPFSSRLKCCGRNAPTSCSLRDERRSRSCAALPMKPGGPSSVPSKPMSTIQSSISSGPGIQASSTMISSTPNETGALATRMGSADTGTAGGIVVRCRRPGTGRRLRGRYILRTTARSTNRQFHRDPDVHRSGSGVFERAENHRRGEVADVAIAPGEHGERRIEQRSRVRIVEADDRDLVGHGHAAGAQLCQAAEREVGARVDDRRHGSVELHERRRLGPTRRLSPVAGPDAALVDLKAVAAHPDLVPGQALRPGRLALDAADVADPAMPVDIGEMTHEQLDACLVREGHPARPDSLDDVVEEHDRQPVAPFDRTDHGPVPSRRTEDEPVDPAGGQGEEGGPLAIGPLVRVHERDLIARRLEPVLGSLEGVGVEARADVRDDEPDHPGRSGSQRLTGGRRVEVEACRGSPYAIACLRRDAAAAGQSAGRRRHRDAGGLGDVRQARRLTNHLTAPIVRPRTRCFWTKIEKITIGRAPTTPAALIAPQSTLIRPMRVAAPMGIVSADGVDVRTRAKRNSL